MVYLGETRRSRDVTGDRAGGLLTGCVEACGSPLETWRVLERASAEVDLKGRWKGSRGEEDEGEEEEEKGSNQWFSSDGKRTGGCSSKHKGFLR